MSRSRGRGEASTSPKAGRLRRGLLLGCFFGVGTLVVAKAARLQLVEHEQWVAAAEDQHRERVTLPARRGTIFDRKGIPLALSHEMYQVSVAPPELEDREATVQALAETLEIPTRRAHEVVQSSERWVVLAGRYTAEQRRSLGSHPGIYFERQFERFYPQGDAGREVIGAVTRDGRALGGIEEELDAVLRGAPGYTILRREASGETRPAISLPIEPPEDGSNAYLTIDFDLQEIGDAALREAIESTQARGGDLLIGDPRTGEILAAVSRRDDSKSRSLTAITEPYEPGSTLKPFLAAALLGEGLVTLEDSVFAEEGVWRNGTRTIRDISPHAWLSLRGALEVSSNIALVKFAARLSPGQQYAYLRDFGCGTPTGIGYPTESTGWLRRPEEWSRLSSASLAMGYEISATPLQMLAAYGALANGGVLMEPYLVREIRASDGRVLERRSPRQLRRVLSESHARALTEVLVSVVETGTATRASLATFAVAGKTGTSRRVNPGGGYEEGAYTSTFVGYFPAQDPQIVIFVKLDQPQGQYYGGLTAAPVTRETLQGILAARNSGLDGRTLLSTRLEAPLQPAPRRTPKPGHVATYDGTYVSVVADGVPPVRTANEPGVTRVPPLEGLLLREAVRRVHAAGLRAHVSGGGRVVASDPAAGVEVSSGGTVTLIAVEAS